MQGFFRIPVTGLKQLEVIASGNCVVFHMLQLIDFCTLYFFLNMIHDDG